MHIHERDIEKIMPSSVMDEEERDVCDRNTTRTYTFKNSSEKKMPSSGMSKVMKDVVRRKWPDGCEDKGLLCSSY